jgi:hypothetical protein
MSDDAEQLDKKVREWLEHEGYPLEFRVAKKFQENGFAIRQGSYVKDPNSDAPREIDVVAFRDGHSKQHLLRVKHIVECKWSKDKPWVVFTSPHGISPSACITQTIASKFGSAILWKEAGLKQLQDLELFLTPKNSGFNGRQAFSKEGIDRFYSAMQSVISAAKFDVDDYDNPNRKPGQLPKAAVVGFPVIVIQGDLFEAFLDPKSSDLVLRRAPHIRCHWKGSKEWSLHATVDIITFEHLDKFLTTRSAQVETLLRIMQMSVDEITKCIENNSIESLNITKGSRGVVGLHHLFREFVGNQKALKPPNTDKKVD